MLISIKVTVVPVITLAIMVLLGILIYRIFSNRYRRSSILYIVVSIVILFGLVVMMNLKNEKGEYFWKSVNETKQEQVKQR